VFKSQEKYQLIRQNAFKTTMDGERVSRAWLGEFCRLKERAFIDYKEVAGAMLNIPPWAPEHYKPKKSLEQLLGLEGAVEANVEDLDLGAEEAKEPLDAASKKKVVSHFERPPQKDTKSVLQESQPDPNAKVPHVFTFQNIGPRLNSVQLCGSFDNWGHKHGMSFDHVTSQWFTTLHLSKGKH